MTPVVLLFISASSTLLIIRGNREAGRTLPSELTNCCHTVVFSVNSPQPVLLELSALLLPQAAQGFEFELRTREQQQLLWKLLPIYVYISVYI